MGTEPIPKLFVMVSTKEWKYLSATTKGLLKFDGDRNINPESRFEAEPSANTTDNLLVHIRSCYNNKYWAKHLTDDGTFCIVASAEKPEEDQSKDFCTLFEAYRTQSKNRVRFRHVQSQMYALNIPTKVDFQLSSSVGEESEFNLFDWEGFVILPKRVTFKLDGNYLCRRWVHNAYYMKFEPNLDIADPQVVMEMVPDNNGLYHIRHEESGYFLTEYPNCWIGCESTNAQTKFSIIKLDDSTVALKCNGYFPGRCSEFEFTNVLRNLMPTISANTKLVVEEAVLSREISDVKYRFSESRVYAEEIVEVDTAFVRNIYPDRDENISITFKKKDITTSHWNATLTLKLGVKSTLKVSIIPKIVEAKAEAYA